MAAAIIDFLWGRPTASPPVPVQELIIARRAMACEFSVTFPSDCRSAVDAGCAALDEVERLEEKLSAYIEDSDLSRLNRSATERPVPVDAEVYAVLRSAWKVSALTGGAFDAAAGALVKAWGFYRGPRRVPTPHERAAALAASGSAHVEFDDNRRTVRFRRSSLEFNLGSIGKGYAIDRALQRIQAEFGVRSALMQGGQSSLKGIGACWTVAIACPKRPGRTVARVRLRDRALGTSGAANQFFVHQGRRYGHVLDPRTGWPAHGLFSASGIARTATEADALSTAFFVLGVDGTRRFCREHPDIGAVLVVPGETREAAPDVVVTGTVDAEVTL